MGNGHKKLKEEWGACVQPEHTSKAGSQLRRVCSRPGLLVESQEGLAQSWVTVSWFKGGLVSFELGEVKAGRVPSRQDTSSSPPQSPGPFQNQTNS